MAPELGFVNKINYNDMLEAQLKQERQQVKENGLLDHWRQLLRLVRNKMGGCLGKKENSEKHLLLLFHLPLSPSQRAAWWPVSNLARVFTMCEVVMALPPLHWHPMGPPTLQRHEVELDECL